MRIPIAVVLLCALALSAPVTRAQDPPPGDQLGANLPKVDADALMAEVNRLAGELRAEAERLIATEGKDAAITRLRAEATANENVAFQRMNLAVVVAALAGDDKGTATILAAETPAATDGELPLALARHAVILGPPVSSAQGAPAREASYEELARQGSAAGEFGAQLSRFATILVGLERLAPDTLDYAASATSVGVVYGARGYLDGALAHFEKGLGIRERLAPGSSDCARSYNNLGLVYRKRGDLDRALEYLQRSLELSERLTSGASDCAAALNNIGLLQKDRGDFDRALECHRRALAIRERLAPGSLDCAASYNNIGRVCYNRGDLDRAMEYDQRALAIFERLAPDTLYCAASYGNMGTVHEARGDLDRAIEYSQKALRITERVAPGSLACASSYDNIGNVHRSRGDLDQALEYCQKGLAIRERLAPGSLDCATGYISLGAVWQLRGALDRAMEYYQEALEIQQRLAPGSLHCAWSYNNIGVVCRDRGDLGQALEHLQKALMICRAKASGSGEHAQVAANAASALARLARAKEARPLYEEAVSALDQARQRSAGKQEDLTRATFAKQYESIYRDYIRFLLEQGDARTATETTERMRAKGLREALFARVEAHEGAAAQSVVVEWERISGIREGLPARIEAAEQRGDKELVAKLEDERRALDQSEADLRERARRDAPAVAGLLFPEKAGLAGLEAILDGDTVALSYVLDKGGINLLVLTSTGPVEHVKLPATADEVRGLLFAPAADGRQSYVDDLGAACAKLWGTLMAPVADRLAGKKRVVVLPDGILYAVPWAALADGNGKALVDRVAVAVLPSLRTLQLLRTEADARAAKRVNREELCALGDAEYPGAPGEYRGADDLRGALDSYSPREAILAKMRAKEPVLVRRLPNTGAEVQEIAAVLGHPEGAHTGAEATESVARRAAPHARYVQFACHGYFDYRNPLNSGLVLGLADANPDDPRADGFLTAADILGMAMGDGASLDADMVVLSACQTAVGKDSGGEGMIGLTRALMFAGTPTVVSTLWSVADESTKELMIRFYENVKAGMDKAEALRQAQLSIRSDTRWSSPYYWAPFMLWGDW